MRICMVGYHAARLGGGIAMSRLATALRREAMAEVFSAAVETAGDCNAFPLATPWKKQLLHLQQALLWRVFSLQRSSNKTAHTFNCFSNHFMEKILDLKPDVVHLHSIVGEMLSIREIAQLCRRVKVVWTLHDSWPFTGTEQHPLRQSTRYIDGYLRSNREDSGIDFDRLFWEAKLKYWQGTNLSFISPSHWIDEALQNSRLWRGAHSAVIGNCIDTTVFTPGSRRAARQRLKLPENELILGFGAGNIANANKGGAELADVLRQVARADRGCHLATVGAGNFASPLPVHHLGERFHPAELIDFYRSCDLFLSTSKYDNLPNMILESMACGTPVATFRTGGIPDLVQPGCGLCAEAFNTAELADMVIQWLKNRDGELAVNGRNHIVRCYSMPVIAQKHLSFYHSL